MEPKNESLWRVAKLRAKFKNSAITYLFVNLVLVAIWYFTSGPSNFFWPGFPIIFWGIGLGAEYYNAYIDKGDAVEKEYEKLLRDQSQ